jgi:hypothetical protein
VLGSGVLSSRTRKGLWGSKAGSAAFEFNRKPFLLIQTMLQINIEFCYG